MERLLLWYITDNDHGRKLAESIRGLGVNCQVIEGFDLSGANIVEHDINIFLIDIDRGKPEENLELIKNEPRIQGYLKLFFLKKREINRLSKKSINIYHLEFISKPVYTNEFLLLLEKSIIVERYRELMKYISKEAEQRIEIYEGIMDINRKDAFISEKEKESFRSIVKYERDLISEQDRLNRVMKDFTLMRQTELFDLKSRIKAEELLEELRRNELMTGQRVIDAHESVLNYSTRELESANSIIEAKDTVAEMSRNEAMSLNEELQREKELNRLFSGEIEKLQSEVESLKKKVNNKDQKNEN